MVNNFFENLDELKMKNVKKMNNSDEEEGDCIDTHKKKKIMDIPIGGNHNSYPFCPLCVETLKSLQNTLFSFGFEELVVEATLNMLMFYMNFFKIELKENKEIKQIVDTKLIYHFSLNNSNICQSNLNQLYIYIRDKLDTEILTQNKVKDNDYTT